jgi:hypothetical protein
LRDHVLTAPECSAWAVVIPCLAETIGTDDADKRWNYAERAAADRGASAQPLYDLYCEAIALDSRDAAALHWFATPGSVTAAIGTSGILMLIEQELVTAFLPGQGSASATRAAQEEGREARGLPRERSMRSGRLGRKQHESPRESRRQQRREAGWTPQERLYYRVFRPAVQFVRRSHHRCRDMYGRLNRGEYALLKEVLPPSARLKYDDWLALRAQCRGGA